MSRRTIVLTATVLVFAVVAATILPNRWMARKLEASLTPAITAVQPITTERSDVPAAAVSVYYPLTNYASRRTVRPYGTPVVLADNQGFPCGDQFSGFHSGDDLEVTAAEVSQAVPVFAIAAGTVRQVGHVGGYGGLIVIEHSLDNQSVTAYYGHVDLTQTELKAGDAVKAGQKITVLGAACSAETSGERKHLHFSIHTGSTVDVRGYVPSETELGNWQDPVEILKRLGAVEPTG